MMNKMKQGLKVYMVAISASEGMFGFINRVRYLCENIKAMGG